MLPAALARAVETLVHDEDPRQLAQDARTLSQRYREGMPSRSGGPLTRSMALAYAAARMPATYGALMSVFSQLKDADPAAAPSSLLDVGAGPGTAMWAAVEAFPTIREIAALEREPAMMSLGQDLAQASAHESLRSAQWTLADASAESIRPYDLVAAGYSLGEINPQERARLLTALWRAARVALVIVEPGTPDGFSRIRAARAELVAQGARVAAPCPHDADCPLAADNWCHFSVRVARSRRQRQLKGGEAPYEDEKYSYVIVAATPPEARHPRVLRHPRISPGRIELTLCGARGLAERTVVRSDGGAFRLARKIRWGDTWDCD